MVGTPHPLLRDWSQGWLVHLEHVRDDSRIRPIVQALGGPWALRAGNTGEWAMLWWVVSSTMAPLTVDD